MQLQSLTAVFGSQGSPPLEFAPGLNIIKLPNPESAPACSALLRDILYGPDPDSLPRSAASQCRLEAATPWGPATIARWSADAPLDSFSAVYTGTTQPMPYLTAASCGEVLLGVPRDLFDRRAVIRAPGPGEGEAALAELRAIPGVLEADRGGQAMLLSRASQLEDALSRHDAADVRDAALAAENAHLDFVSLRDKVKTMEASQKAPPTKAELTSIRAALDSLEAQEGPIQQSRQRLRQAEKALQFARSALEAQPPAGPPPSEAAPRLRPSLRGLLCALLGGAALGAVVMTVWERWLWAAAGGLAFALVLLLCAAVLPLIPQRKAWKLRQAELAEQYERSSTAYTTLYENAEKAQAAYQDAEEAANAVSAAYQASLEQILNRVRSFRPFAKDLYDARQAIASGLVARRELDQALQALEEARLRWEALQSGAAYPLPPPVRRPAESREQLQQELAEVRSRLEALQERWSASLADQAGAFYTRLTQERTQEGRLGEDADYQLYLAARLTASLLALPPDAPVLLECALDGLDGGDLTAALDCLVELSQSRQVLLLTPLDRELSCLRRTHPDRFHLTKL